MQDEDFEVRLREDLPRGKAPQVKSAGRERSVFAHWLTPDKMAGDQWQPKGGLLLGRRDARSRFQVVPNVDCPLVAGGCVIRRKSTTRSDASRPPILAEAGHPF